MERKSKTPRVRAAIKTRGNSFAAVNMESAGLSLLDNFNQTGLHIAPLYGALQIMDVLG